MDGPVRPVLAPGRPGRPRLRAPASADVAWRGCGELTAGERVDPAALVGAWACNYFAIWCHPRVLKASPDPFPSTPPFPPLTSSLLRSAFVRPQLTWSFCYFGRGDPPGLHGLRTRSQYPSDTMDGPVRPVLAPGRPGMPRLRAPASADVAWRSFGDVTGGGRVGPSRPRWCVGM